MHRLKLLPRVLLCMLFMNITCMQSAITRAQEDQTNGSSMQPAVTVEQAGVDFMMAVLTFKEDENLKGVGAQTAELMQANLAENTKFMFVERTAINNAFSELELGLSGTVDPSTAAKIGHIIGAKVIITGSVFTMDNQITFMAKIIGVETGRVYAESVTQSLKEPKEEGIKKLTAKVSETIAQKGKSLLAKEDEADDTLEKYSVALKDKKLPAVSIRIEEQHMNHSVIDPAAETEAGIMLQSVGFPLLDQSSSNKLVDVEITGAAFSEYAGRTENLFSCKARVEIKAVEVKTGRILAVDRETDVAVDLSENVAGKLAIEKATRKIVNRIIPKLVL